MYSLRDPDQGQPIETPARSRALQRWQPLVVKEDVHARELAEGDLERLEEWLRGLEFFDESVDVEELQMGDANPDSDTDDPDNALGLESDSSMNQGDQSQGIHSRILVMIALLHHLRVSQTLTVVTRWKIFQDLEETLIPHC